MPAVRVDRELLGDGRQIALATGQEQLHEPATVEQRPLDARRGFAEHLSEGLARVGVEARQQGKGLDVADPLGRDEPLAFGRLDARCEDGAMDGHVARVICVDEG